MGLNISHCEDCNTDFIWYITLNYNDYKCSECGYYNSKMGLLSSIDKPNYWVIHKRKEKLKKIIDNIK